VVSRVVFEVIKEPLVIVGAETARAQHDHDALRIFLRDDCSASTPSSLARSVVMISACWGWPGSRAPGLRGSSAARSQCTRPKGAAVARA
jgi:hypothetical protein